MTIPVVTVPFIEGMKIASVDAPIVHRKEERSWEVRAE